jgi:hypothetical protein
MKLKPNTKTDLKMLLMLEILFLILYAICIYITNKQYKEEALILSWSIYNFAIILAFVCYKIEDKIINK